jgi:hypothetical protein
LSTFNLNNPREISWREYVDLLRSNGFKLDLVPLNLWREKYLARIDEDNAMYPFKEFYIKERKDLMSRNWRKSSSGHSREVQEKLQGYGIFYPQDYAGYTGVFLSYLVGKGFLAKQEGE